MIDIGQFFDDPLSVRADGQAWVVASSS